ncbi:marine proteobacterial sortase target protein [Sphingomonas paucimobilis]|nr:marine proteobacterial sortase target protein [Sphingomonas paucimobilis]
MRDDFEQIPFGGALPGEDRMPFGDVEFADNSEPRCACMLVLDTSGSMEGEPIAQLNKGLEQFAQELREDRLAAKRADICVITFGDTVNVVAEFGSAQNFYPQPLRAHGGTPMGEAINCAIDLVLGQQARYRANGIMPYRPWIFMLTDGTPTDDVSRAARRVREAHERKSFSFFAVGVDQADMSTLAAISVNAPLKLRGLAFSDLFRWLSSSLSAVSRSSVGGKVLLANPTGPDGWAEID